MALISVLPQTVPLGTVHPAPCPDCGGTMELRKNRDDRLFYHCTLDGCSGNASATEAGQPHGRPIDKEGRRKRVELHRLIDHYWFQSDAQYWQNSTRRSLIYTYLNLVMNMEEFHIGWLDHKQLDEVTEFVQGKTFRAYMAFNGLGE